MCRYFSYQLKDVVFKLSATTPHIYVTHSKSRLDCLLIIFYYCISNAICNVLCNMLKV